MMSIIALSILSTMVEFFWDKWGYELIPGGEDLKDDAQKAH
jgi:hypothetical protein